MQHRELFLHSFDPVVFVDPEDLSVLDANPAFYAFTGRTPESASAHSVLEWIARMVVQLASGLAALAVTGNKEALATLSILMMILLERSRG